MSHAHIDSPHAFCDQLARVIAAAQAERLLRATIPEGAPSLNAPSQQVRTAVDALLLYRGDHPTLVEIKRRACQYLGWSTGHVYVAAAEARPGLVKIGTSRVRKRRAQGLERKFGPLVHFELVAEVPLWLMVDVEARAHQVILLQNADAQAAMASYGDTPGDWFECTIEEACEAVRVAAEAVTADT